MENVHIKESTFFMVSHLGLFIMEKYGSKKETRQLIRTQVFESFALLNHDSAKKHSQQFMCWSKKLHNLT